MNFLVMEYILGMTLDKKLAAGPLPEKNILGLGTQLAEGLSAAHECAVVHCDLKPANVQLGDGARRIKILDFGLAKLLNRALGTPVTFDRSRCCGRNAALHGARATARPAG